MVLIPAILPTIFRLTKKIATLGLHEAESSNKNLQQQKKPSLKGRPSYPKSQTTYLKGRLSELKGG